MLPSQQFLRLVEKGKLEVYPVISPPRSGSTLMGVSVSQNSAIHGYCHEPFFNLKYGDNAEKAYQMMLDAYEKVKQSGITRLAVQEMTHWLAIDQEYKRFLSMVKPPLFLIRNPLLAMESRLRKLTGTFTMRDKKALRERLEELVDTKGLAKDLTFISDAECSSYQLNLLNRYAEDKGFTDWTVFCGYAYNERDFRPFADLLQEDKIFSLYNSGWEALEEELSWIRQKGKTHILVDTTEYQLAPLAIAPQVCQFWGLDFEKKMVSWGQGNVNISTGQNKPYQQIWYADLKLSAGIKPPQESPNVLDNFPEFIADYVEKYGLPIYHRTYILDSRLEPGDNLVEMELFPDFHDMPLKVRELDPIFAGLHDPSLITDPRFVTETILYQRELTALSHDYNPKLAEDNTDELRQAMKVMGKQIENGNTDGEVIGKNIVLQYKVEES